MAPFSPEAEAQMEELRRRREAIRAEHGLVDNRMGAHTIGTLSEVTPGCEVWAVEDGRRDWHGECLGGIVLDVGSRTDEEGTIETTFRCYDPLAPWPHRAFTTLAESEINPRSISAPSTVSLVAAVRKFCRQVGNHNLRVLDAGEAELVTHAHRLVAVLMGGPTR